jgi:hypothetical protein
MDPRGECDVRQFELAVLRLERQWNAGKVPSDDNRDIVPETVADSTADPEAPIIWRREVVGIQRHLTRPHAKKEPMGVKFFPHPSSNCCGPCLLGEKRQ